MHRPPIGPPGTNRSRQRYSKQPSPRTLSESGQIEPQSNTNTPLCRSPSAARGNGISETKDSITITITNRIQYTNLDQKPSLPHS